MIPLRYFYKNYLIKMEKNPKLIRLEWRQTNLPSKRRSGLVYGSLSNQVQEYLNKMLYSLVIFTTVFQPEICIIRSYVRIFNR